MSFDQIEAELPRLSPEELRQLALKSWTTYVEKEDSMGAAAECSEDDPELLAALDEAIVSANACRGQGLSAHEARARLNEWTTK